MLELGSAVAAGLYVVLTVFYDRFYSPLGLELGDVGLDRAAIVSRTVGGVIAIIGLMLSPRRWSRLPLQQPSSRC